MTEPLEQTCVRTAKCTILDQATCIAIEQKAPPNAQRWLGRVWDAIDDLAGEPGQHGLAPENWSKPYQVRRALPGDHLILFTIEAASYTVWVI
jgi:hypothetical protein